MTCEGRSHYEANPEAFAAAGRFQEALDFLYPPGSRLNEFLAQDPTDRIQAQLRDELREAATRLSRKGWVT